MARQRRGNTYYGSSLQELPSIKRNWSRHFVPPVDIPDRILEQLRLGVLKHIIRVAVKQSKGEFTHVGDDAATAFLHRSERLLDTYGVKW